MKLLKILGHWGWLLMVAAALSGCLKDQNTVELQSDAGDYIGGGSSYKYTQADAVISLSVTGTHLSIRIDGDQGWTADFQAPNSLTQLEVGTYTNLQRYPFSDPSKGGLSWGGEGRGCNTLQGWFAIDGVTYSNGVVTAIDLRFEQHCEGSAPALRGTIHWNVNDTTTPPGPVNPPPANLWQPASDATPSSGNYVYLQSTPGDYIGMGRTDVYTQADATISVSVNAGHLSVRINGNETWDGDFQAMSTLSQLQPGYYANLKRYPFGNPTKGSLSWSGAGRGCNTVQGWFAVDNVTYTNGLLTAIDVRFEQHCDGMLSPLRGKVHWGVGDTTAPPGPVNPPPASLWEPASGVTPTSGNFVYLQSDSGDYIGQGQTTTFTPANSTISLGVTNGHLSVSVVVNGMPHWFGDFQTMNSLSSLQPGYYGNLERYPFHNPTKGGLNWGGEGRGCNTLTGWFAVDNVVYANGLPTALDLRFEQHCEGASPALRGMIHWSN